MSWYFLGGFSAYAMLPSGRVVNHSGCAATHGWSGAACRAKSRATSSPSARAARTNARKSASVPRSGWTVSCPPSSEPIAHGEPGSPGCGSRVLLRPLRFSRPIGMDGREVEDVEAHRGHAGQPADGRAERAALDRAVLQPARSLGAREELVPRADAGPLALDEQFEARADGHRARRGGARRRTRRSPDRARSRARPRRSRRDRAASSRRSRSCRRSAIGRDFSATARSNSRAPISRITAVVHAGSDLQIRRVLPRREVVGECLEPEPPHALLEGRDRGLPAVEPVVERMQPVKRFVARGGEEPHVDADAIVTLAERGRAEGDDFSGERAGPELPIRNGGRGQRERDARGRRRAFGLRIGCRSDRDRRGAAPGARCARSASS